MIGHCERPSYVNIAFLYPLSQQPEDHIQDVQVPYDRGKRLMNYLCQYLGFETFVKVFLFLSLFIYLESEHGGGTEAEGDRES